jgi:CheY-like chemotaxis protein
MNRTAAGRTLEILMVEDNPGDVRLVTEVVSEAKLHARLSAVRDGEEGLAFLRREGKYAQAPIPDLVLLDLNLPRKDGRELLAEIKRDPHLRHLPVIVLTTSRAEQDILKSYDLHANCYIIKPLGLDQVFSVMRSVVEFWFSVATLPTPH